MAGVMISGRQLSFPNQSKEKRVDKEADHSLDDESSFSGDVDEGLNRIQIESFVFISSS